MTAPLALLRNHDQAEHAEPGHPERPERVTAILGHVQAQPDLAALPWLEPRPGSADLPLQVHTPGEVAAVRSLAESGGGWFDPDTYCTARSYAVALDAAACSARAAGAVAAGEVRAAFALVRPPGHHATPARPMGFCLFNNAAIAVRVAQQRAVQRVAIIDIDVHHGNGTQDIFYSDRDVLYTSLHQFPFYPGTGSFDERGAGAGSGTTVNVPLAAGSDGAAWLRAFDDHVAVAVDSFRPELIVVSAGFDAHSDDPLAELRLDDATYRDIAERVRALAELHASGRSVWLLEGGYDLRAISHAVAATLRVLGRP